MQQGDITQNLTFNIMFSSLCSMDSDGARMSTERNAVVEKTSHKTGR
jgi:hypothetical protein